MAGQTVAFYMCLSIYHNFADSSVTHFSTDQLIIRYVVSDSWADAGPMMGLFALDGWLTPIRNDLSTHCRCSHTLWSADD